MRPKKYNFIPEHQIKEDLEQSDFSVTINKTFNIYFSPFDVGMYELAGKTIRIYADVGNKTIAWKEITAGPLHELENVRQFKKGEMGQVTISVTKILRKMGVTKEMLPFKKIPVIDYKDTLIDGKFNVIDLRDYIKTNEKSTKNDME